MKPCRNIVREEDGAALIIALCVIGVILILGATVAAMATNSEKTIGHDAFATITGNIAEAGVDETIAVTTNNYYQNYPSGLYPTSYTQFFTPTQLKDGSGNVIGTYQTWTMADPARPGDVLIKSTGVLAANNTFSTTIEVSVKYSPPMPIFDYALVLGDPANKPNQMQMQANGRNATITGGVQISAGQFQGQDQVFFKRNGMNDAVTYTGTYQCQCSGNEPFVKGTTTSMPTINFSAFTPGSVAVTFNSSGVPAGGWSRNGNTFSISSANFQTAYKDKVVVLDTNVSGITVNITGPATITASIISPGKAGSAVGISQINFSGPNLTLLPKNGVAILTGEGIVDFSNGVTVGAPGQGALVMMTSQNAGGTGDATQFQLQGSLTAYGEVIYATRVTQGQFQSDGTGDLSITYDGAFKTNPNLPSNWVSAGSGPWTAVKVNYVKR